MIRVNRHRDHRALFVLMIFVFVAILSVPHLSRIRHSSIYSDDIHRIADLQTRPLGALWFRPFNEHMSPFFETVSWLTWQAAGRELTNAPLAFTLASYVPFVLCLGLLTWWVRIETGSLTAALTSTAIFGLSPLYAETAYWYSASSFTWALFWTILVLLHTGSADASRGSGHRLVLLIGSLLAPAASAVGLLAGPLGSLRLAAEPREQQRRRDWFTIATPMLGTLIYLVGCASFRYVHVLQTGIHRSSDIPGGFILALRAPTAYLIPGTFGVQNIDLWLPSGLNLALTGLGLAAIIAWSKRNHQRGLIATALALILGGYAITYPFRNDHGDHWLLQIERFHMFPQLGLVILITLFTQRRLSRFDQRPLMALALPTVIAALLLGINLSRFERSSRIYHFPEQPRTLAALNRLGAICRDEKITRQQCIAELEPVLTHWFQADYNGLWMVPIPDGVSGHPDSRVQGILLDRLDANDRKALWGGMDISRYAIADEHLIGTSQDSPSIGRLVKTDGARRGRLTQEPGMREYTMTAWPAYLEFEMPASRSPNGAPLSDPRFLCLTCGPSAEPLEIYWAKLGEDWSPARCVRFKPAPGEPPRRWALPLDRMPHWNPADADRIRIRFVTGPIIAVGEPRLIR